MNIPQQSDLPELVFGLVGPLGVDMDAVQNALAAALRQVEYEPHIIHLTKEIRNDIKNSDDGSVEADTYANKITTINDLRTKTKREDILSLFSVLKIVSKRTEVNSKKHNLKEQEAASTPLRSTAYIVRQLKRSEEIRTLSRIYGNRFFQVSVSIGEKQQEQTVTSIVSKETPSLSDAEVSTEVNRLISIDQNEDNDPFGQRLSDTFQSGDVFIDGSNAKSIRGDCLRFINALFGMNSLSPTKDEFGSYLAKSASLRSIDLSRQVGSAIMSSDGDIISIGCNEVPRPGGGNYWCSDDNPQRDMDRKLEANKLETSRIIHNFIDVISKHGSLTKDPAELLKDPKFQQLLKKSLISDITEFGRMTHAEMSALTDAARLGLSTKGATIYVTTYPCHNCAKHLIAAGISRIVYIEPYPKSRAITLHDDALTHHSDDNIKVKVEHFHGISPRRFREIFEKSKRKDKENSAMEWYEATPKPMIAERYSTHVLLEPAFLEIFHDAFKEV